MEKRSNYTLVGGGEPHTDCEMWKEIPEQAVGKTTVLLSQLNMSDAYNRNVSLEQKFRAAVDGELDANHTRNHETCERLDPVTNRVLANHPNVPAEATRTLRKWRSWSQRFAVLGAALFLIGCSNTSGDEGAARSSEAPAIEAEGTADASPSDGEDAVTGAVPNSSADPPPEIRFFRSLWRTEPLDRLVSTTMQDQLELSTFEFRSVCDEIAERTTDSSSYAFFALEGGSGPPIECGNQGVFSTTEFRLLGYRAVSIYGNGSATQQIELETLRNAYRGEQISGAEFALVSAPDESWAADTLFAGEAPLLIPQEEQDPTAWSIVSTAEGAGRALDTEDPTVVVTELFADDLSDDLACVITAEECLFPADGPEYPLSESVWLVADSTATADFIVNNLKIGPAEDQVLKSEGFWIDGRYSDGVTGQ